MRCSFINAKIHTTFLPLTIEPEHHNNTGILAPLLNHASITFLKIKQKSKTEYKIKYNVYVNIIEEDDDDDEEEEEEEEEEYELNI
ncbi:hypothetical protein T07_401 [Trichinella nelsoni]|uniref:Uncharacterized protein n=1 Tax=Trichinella nelsoni TaxID=6336 RepID=A0A0V0SN06_9BILA|nr:hypothetical protein T07_401 [Trichinella nelsoni]